MAIRVPTPVGSLVDVCFVIKKKADEKQINQAFKKAARSTSYKKYIKTTEEPLVLADIVGNSASAIVDLNFTKVVDNDLVKVVAWYDNEWGYANRLVDLCKYIKKYI